MRNVRAHFQGAGLMHEKESRLPAALAVAATIVLSVTLSSKFSYGPIWLLPTLSTILLVSLTVSAPHRHGAEPDWQRIGGIVLIALINLSNVISLILLIESLLHGSKTDGTTLLVDAFKIWLTNVIVFGLWYWELDGGGPGARMDDGPEDRTPDFLFPQLQMRTQDGKRLDWSPRFVDYLYVSFTNATAFSPTDTMPLGQWAKFLMALQALASLVTVALVAARAVNILQ